MEGGTILNFWSGLPQEMRDRVREFMDIQQLVAFGHTNARNDMQCRATMFSRVKNILRDRGLDPVETLKEMGRLNVVLSGSAALAVVADQFFEPGDLDFFAESKEAKDFFEYVLANTGYMDVTTEKRAAIQAAKFEQAHQTFYDHGRGDSWDVRWLEAAGTGWKMNIVSTGSETPFDTVMYGFNSTLVMNVVTHLGVGCAYPSLVRDRVGIWRRPAGMEDDSRVREREAKYSERGYRHMTLEDWAAEVGEDKRAEVFQHNRADALTSVLWLSYPHRSYTDAVNSTHFPSALLTKSCKG